MYILISRRKTSIVTTTGAAQQSRAMCGNVLYYSRSFVRLMSFPMKPEWFFTRNFPPIYYYFYVFHFDRMHEIYVCLLEN